MDNLKSCFLKITFACLFMAFTMYAQKPQLTGTDLVCNGESFFEMTQIRNELSNLARADGVLIGNDNFNQVAASGQRISVIKNNFINCRPQPKYLVTDGGGIDLFMGSCQPGDKNCSLIQSVKKEFLLYLEEIKKSNVKAFVWMGYPEAPGNQNLTNNQAIWTEVTKEIIAQVTEPKAIYVDLLPVYEGHYNEYFNAGDGLHPNLAGSKAAAKAFWDAMKADNYAFFDTLGPVSVFKPAINNNQVLSAHILSQVLKNGNLSVSLSVYQPSNIVLNLTTISGRNILKAEQFARSHGQQTLMFPIGSVAPGIYNCQVKAGQSAAQSTLLVP